MNICSILSYLGVVLEIDGILSLIPVIVSGIYQDGMHAFFLIASIIAFVSGTILDRRFEKDDLDLGSAMVISALSFIIISLLGALPFLSVLHPADALFESVSGFTTTGLTVIQPESFAPSLIFWRSFTQWIGGVGILLISLLLVGSPGISSYYLYRAESRTEKIEASVRGTVKTIFMIYAVYTCVGAVLFFSAGMPFFDSIVVAFSSVSTGGFTPTNNSIGTYNNPFIEAIAIFLMILGATSFFIHYELWKGNIKKYIKNSEIRLFWGLIAVFSLLLSFLFADNGIKNGIFYTFSALTTTGFSTLKSVSGTPEFLLILLMIVGGCAGSTAGGLKLVRAGIAWKAFAWIGKKISLPPEAVVPLKYQEKTIKDSETAIIMLFVCMYIGILFITTFILSLLGYPPLDSLFEAASAQGTVGLSVIEISTMPVIGKFLLMLNMLLGRLEIFPFLVLMYSVYRGVLRTRD